MVVRNRKKVQLSCGHMREVMTVSDRGGYFCIDCPSKNNRIIKVLS